MEIKKGLIGDCPLLKLYLNDKMIGHASYSVNNDIGMLYTISINTSQRGRGYGRLLFDRCIDTMREEGVNRVKVVVLGDKDNHPMMALIDRYCSIENDGVYTLLLKN